MDSIRMVCGTSHLSDATFCRVDLEMIIKHDIFLVVATFKI